MNSFGTEFRKARTAAGLTMGQVARALGVSVSSVSDIEHSRRPPPSQDRLANLMTAGLAEDVVRGLTRLAAHVKQTFQLAGTTENKLELAATLERSWGSISEDNAKLISEYVAQVISRPPPEED